MMNQFYFKEQWGVFDLELSLKEVDHVARLARLALDDSEKAKMAEQMGSILEYAEAMNKLDTQGVEPLAHVFPTCNVFREDVAGESLDIEKALQNAPDRDERCFKVPNVMD